MSLFKFFAAFVVTALIVFAMVFGWNWKSFTTFIENREAMAEGSQWVEKTYSLRGLSEYIDENPEHVSIASIVVGKPDSTLFFREDVSRTMGTAGNYLLLLAYAMEIDSGAFSGEEMIRWDEVSLYQLPDVEASVHNYSYRAAQNRGWASNGEISLFHALKLAAEFNNLALSDYLWWKLDGKVWDELPEKLQLGSTDMPLPFSGLYLAISPGIQQKSAEEIEAEWADKSPAEWRLHVETVS
jgi:hypothetical protein